MHLQVWNGCVYFGSQTFNNDRRCQLVCHITAAHGLHVEMNIDITLREKNILVRNWKVVDKGNSDHRFILFEIGGRTEAKEIEGNWIL